jgi:hypothetical protein
VDIQLNGDIQEKYLAPHRALNLTNEPLPPIMDAIAYNLGARIVVDYNGDVYLERFKEAMDDFNQDLDTHMKPPQFLGGDFRYVIKY